jgi:hypothetical protein
VKCRVLLTIAGTRTLAFMCANQHRLHRSGARIVLRGQRPEDDRAMYSSVVHGDAVEADCDTRLAEEAAVPEFLWE